jgi:adenine-specific DNA methylase
MTNITETILAINSSAEVKVVADDINQITWLNGTTPISNEDILAKQSELQAEYDANQYQRDRANEYPSWQDQMDMQYWDKVNNTSTWQDAVQAVKDKYPKL